MGSPVARFLTGLISNVAAESPLILKYQPFHIRTALTVVEDWATDLLACKHRRHAPP